MHCTYLRIHYWVSSFRNVNTNMHVSPLGCNCNLGPQGGVVSGEVGMVRTSSDSVGGWGLTPYEEEKMEEERLRKELKQVKKKQKQQQKMQVCTCMWLLSFFFHVYSHCLPTESHAEIDDWIPLYDLLVYL